MKLRSNSRQSISSHKFITSTNKETCTRGSVSRQEHLNDEFISSMPSTSKNITNTSSTPLSVYGTRRSSTASAEFSPDSPGFGRVAKSNARLLNGLDLTRKSGASSSYLGTAVVLPELKTFELSEKCPTLFKLLKTGSDAARKFSAEQQLTTLQFELEELCAQNVDYQSTIHGEITYLTTGEYPTVNLRNRAMPIFTKVGQEEIQKLAERVKRSVPTPTSMSLADLGILSSPEDDEETPHILDVPQRFWTWAKEYLRYINLDYVNEFKEKMLDRFSEENIIGNYCSQLNIESVSSSIPSTQQNSKTPNNVITSINKSSKKRKRVLSSSSGSSSDSSASVCVTPLKKFNFIRGPKGRFKKQKSLSSNTVVSSVVNSKTVSGQSFRSRAASEKFAITKNSNGSSEKLLIEIDTSSIMTPLLTPNGLHPCLNNTKNSSNGLKSSQNDAKQQKQIKETPKLLNKKLLIKRLKGLIAI
ncbi:hypothetical protein Mgra_00002835 [Meloidogyne graminicola]|uniref:Uncharacterized protein n=1 Tax=Meloidogyne graminicola TaxID=189291 RepID=A0A8S9ZVG7_9BILA|nr:hypothetical protein Mgra_00002835 [Meloidogyne graminicola]KAF7637577.1 hypothetical protein Mgra_00002835 [Meloidogyne graminicola]